MEVPFLQTLWGALFETPYDEDFESLSKLRKSILLKCPNEYVMKELSRILNIHQDEICERALHEIDEKSKLLVDELRTYTVFKWQSDVHARVAQFRPPPDQGRRVHDDRRRNRAGLAQRPGLLLIHSRRGKAVWSPLVRQRVGLEPVGLQDVWP